MGSFYLEGVTWRPWFNAGLRWQWSNRTGEQVRLEVDN